MRDESPSFGSGEWQQAKQTNYDPDSDGELATTLVYAVADVKGVDPLDRDQLPVLYDVVDAEFLEETFVASAERAVAGEGAFCFQYADVMVTVERNGWITVYDQE